MKVQPLKGYGAFEAALKAGTRYTVGPVGLTVVVNSTPTTSTLSVGVAIGKRNAKRAVARSRMRRLLRVAASHAAEHHASALTGSGIHTLVFVWRRSLARACDVALGDVEPYVFRAVEKAVVSAASSAHELGRKE